MANSGKDGGAHSPYWVTVSEHSKSATAHISPSASRNTEPILDVLAGLLPASGRAVEVASGTGQHASAMAARFPHIHWTPSDPDRDARSSISAWRAQTGLGNLAEPLDLDLTRPGWNVVFSDKPLDAVIAINVVHISPWAATLGLLDGAAGALAGDGLLFIYSCFTRDGVQLSASNVAFDKSLRARNPAWGLRDTRDVANAAAARGLRLEEIFEMPANNLSVAFRKVG